MTATFVDEWNAEPERPPPHLHAPDWLDSEAEPREPSIAELEALDPPRRNGHRAAAATPSRESWQPIDVAPLMAGITDGTLARPAPTIGERSDGAALFYAGRLNGVFGRYGTAKSFVALIVAVQEILAGRLVWWLDFEDNPYGIAERLVDLGASLDAVAARLTYRNPHEGLDADTAAAVLASFAAETPCLVVVDSAGEWMGLHGIETHRDEQVAAWLKVYLGPFTRGGAAVVTIDHVPHEAADKLRAIGSQRKVAAITGVAYLAETIIELGRNRLGKVRLVAAKDRCGTYPRGTVAAELTVDATTNPYGITLAAPPDRAIDGPLPDEKPAVRRVLAALQKAGDPIGTSALGDLVAADGQTGTGLKKQTIQDACNRLRDLGLAHVVDTDHYGGQMWASALKENTP